MNKTFTLQPVKEWEIYLVQHTHTDIGYTRPQTEILPEHLRYIDHALDFCDQTDHYPDAAKFRWTCETSWSVREYLRSRPQEQIDRLIARIKEGRIEATGMFLNYSEIIDEAALVEHCRSHPDFRAGLDVFENEPAMATGLAELDNVIVVPHIASATRWTREGMAILAACNVAGLLRGDPLWEQSDIRPFLGDDPPRAIPSIVNAQELGIANGRHVE